MNEILQNIMENLTEVNKVTLDFLDKIPVKLFHQKAFPGRFKSFAWEFACIITTREMYINGLKKGILNEKTNCRKDEEIEKLSKDELKKLISGTYNQLVKLMKDNKIQEIDFWGTTANKETVLSWLMQHEQLHFGKLMLYLSNNNLTLPKSLMEIWGYGSFSKKN